MRPEEQLQRYALTIDRVRMTADPAPGFHCYHALAFREETRTAKAAVRATCLNFLIGLRSSYRSWLR